MRARERPPQKGAELGAGEAKEAKGGCNHPGEHRDLDDPRCVPQEHMGLNGLPALTWDLPRQSRPSRRDFTPSAQGSSSARRDCVNLQTTNTRARTGFSPDRAAEVPQAVAEAARISSHDPSAGTGRVRFRLHPHPARARRLLGPGGGRQAAPCGISQEEDAPDRRVRSSHGAVQHADANSGTERARTPCQPPTQTQTAPVQSPPRR